FDVPSREKCTVKRPRTNTPLQALVTLNDPQFVEAARVLAARLINEREDTKSRIRHAYKLVTSREANSREIAILTETLEEQIQEFSDAPAKAQEYLSVGEHKRDEKIDSTEHAAWSVISQLILNLDEALTRG
ncbi:MAG: acyl transferase domain-containing protein, partial [Yoonia sp.]